MLTVVKLAVDAIVCSYARAAILECARVSGVETQTSTIVHTGTWLTRVTSLWYYTRTWWPTYTQWFHSLSLILATVCLWYTIGIILIANCGLPFSSQLYPVKFPAHMHWYEGMPKLAKGRQVPLFWQGLDSHGLAGKPVVGPCWPGQRRIQF